MKRRTSVEDATVTNRESENDVTMKKETSEDATINRKSEDDLTTMKKKTKTVVTVAIESSFTDLKSRRTLISAAASPCSEGAAIVRKRRSGMGSFEDCLSQRMREYKHLRQQEIANACAFCLHQCHESPSTLRTCYAKTSTPPSHRLHLHVPPHSNRELSLSLVHYTHRLETFLAQSNRSCRDKTGFDS